MLLGLFAGQRLHVVDAHGTHVLGLIAPTEHGGVEALRRGIVDEQHERVIPTPSPGDRLLDENRLDSTRYRRNRIHRIDATDALARHTASSKLDTSWAFFSELHAAGRELRLDHPVAGHFGDFHEIRRGRDHRHSIHDRADRVGVFDDGLHRQ